MFSPQDYIANQRVRDRLVAAGVAPQYHEEFFNRNKGMSSITEGRSRLYHAEAVARAVERFVQELTERGVACDYEITGSQTTSQLKALKSSTIAAKPGGFNYRLLDTIERWASAPRPCRSFTLVVNEIALTSGLSLEYTTNRISRLEAAGFIAPGPEPRLTAKGRQALRDAALILGTKDYIETLTPEAGFVTDKEFVSKYQLSVANLSPLFVSLRETYGLQAILGPNGRPVHRNKRLLYKEPDVIVAIRRRGNELATQLEDALCHAQLSHAGH